MIVRMWEVRAEQRNFTELLTWVCDVAVPSIEVSPLHVSSEVFSSTGLPARGDLQVAQQPGGVQGAAATPDHAPAAHLGLLAGRPLTSADRSVRSNSLTGEWDLGAKITPSRARP